MKKLLSVSIMAHPDRISLVAYLQERFGGGIPVAWDEGEGMWSTCRWAWLKHDPKAKYHVVIQDDAIVCDDFMNKAEEFLRRFDAPNRAFSFYYGNKRSLRQAAKEAMGKGFAVRKYPGWGVALCLPTKLIPQMITECDAMNNPQDDVRIGKFLAGNNIKIYYPMPSLIDHRADVKSLVGNTGIRRAWYYIDR